MSVDFDKYIVPYHRSGVGFARFRFVHQAPTFCCGNSAALKTDRIPSPEFESCLRGNKIDPDLLPDSIRSALALEFGSEKKLSCFFGQFEFLHSLPHIEELETRLWERIAADTDELGWYAFRSAVQRWSVKKNQPEPDGRIRHFHLSQVFATERPSKMPQGFDIPQDYQVPETTFAEAFFNSITTSDGVSVLWAPPGRGKSTFLSYCTGQKADEVVFMLDELPDFEQPAADLPPPVASNSAEP